MIAKELLTDLIPLVTPSDTGVLVNSWMDTYRVSHLPFSDGEVYTGLITEADILNLADPDQPIGNHLFNLNRVYVFEDQHLFEAVEEIASRRLTLLPVIDRTQKYLGCITLPDLINHFGAMISSGQPGAILVVQMAARDYTLTTLSRIIEENQARILNLFLVPVADTGDVRVTMKISTTEIRSIGRSLERYGYQVTGWYLDNQNLGEFYRERYEELMKYINL